MSSHRRPTSTRQPDSGYHYRIDCDVVAIVNGTARHRSTHQRSNAHHHANASHFQQTQQRPPEHLRVSALRDTQPARHRRHRIVVTPPSLRTRARQPRTVHAATPTNPGGIPASPPSPPFGRSEAPQRSSGFSMASSAARSMSSKYGCSRASFADMRLAGSYSNSRLMRSMPAGSRPGK